MDTCNSCATCKELARHPECHTESTYPSCRSFGLIFPSSPDAGLGPETSFCYLGIQPRLSSPGPGLSLLQNHPILTESDIALRLQRLSPLETATSCIFKEKVQPENLTFHSQHSGLSSRCFPQRPPQPQPLSVV